MPVLLLLFAALTCGASAEQRGSDQRRLLPSNLNAQQFYDMMKPMDDGDMEGFKWEEVPGSYGGPELSRPRDGYGSRLWQRVPAQVPNKRSMRCARQTE